MGTFVTQEEDPVLFASGEKEPAPGLSLRPGWTIKNVTDADDVNGVHDALMDLRSYVRGDLSLSTGDSLSVTATGSTTARTAAKRAADVFRVLDYAAADIAEGGDITTAFQAALAACGDAGGGTVIAPKGTYDVDGSTPLLVESNTAIISEGCTLRLKAGTYGSLAGLLTTRTSMNGGYDAGIAITENVRIEGLTLDGNIANVTGACNGIFLYRVKNAHVLGCTVKDLPGTAGTSYGISSWYSETVRVRDCVVDRTDRQNVLIWETTDAIVEGCDLNESYYRDNILVSGNTPPSLQDSHCIVRDNRCNNLTDASAQVQHAIRFSSGASGVIEGNKIAAHASHECVYITDARAKTVKVARNFMTGGIYGVLVESDVDKSVTIDDNDIISCVNGIRVNAAGGAIRITDNRIKGTTTQPLYVAFADSKHITGNVFDGGTQVFVRADAGLSGAASGSVFAFNSILNLTNGSAALSVGGTATEEVDVIGNVFDGNTANVISHLAKGVIAGNRGVSAVSSTTAEVVQGGLRGSAVWDPGSLADGAGETSSAITVTGAAFGDQVSVGAPYDLQGIIATAYVSAADAVKIRIQNETGGTIDLASGTWRVFVHKRQN